MANADFTVENPLEELLVKAQRRLIPMRDLLVALMQADVFIPTASEVRPDSEGFAPMLFNRNGEALMAVFSATDRIKRYSPQFSYCLAMNGAKLVHWIPVQYGIVVNPGYQVGLEIPATGVKQIRQDFPLTPPRTGLAG
jgi:hypothetical protein